MITSAQYEHLLWCWESETNDIDTQTWRDELTPEEQELIDQWDNGYYNGLAKMYQAVYKAGV